MVDSLFITGGTGMVGKELVPLFLKHTDWEIYLLVHDRSEIEASKRVHLVPGDITQENLGIADPSFARDVTHIIHAAATTRFDLPLEEARRINVQGTANVLSFARGCDALKQFGFVSTAYVSGKRMGSILENERVHDAGFVNSYEQSKYEAEGLVEEAVKSGLPAATYRLSTILGDSRTGKVLHFTAPHQSLRIMYLGLASMVPGTPDYSVDLIPSDYAALTLFRLFSGHFQAGEVFHITAGKAKSYTLKELIDRSFEYLGEFDPEWGKRQYPKPAIASAEAFGLFLQSVKDADNHLLRGVVIHEFLRAAAQGRDKIKILAVPSGLARELFEVADELREIQSPYYGKVEWHGLDLDEELVGRMAEKGRQHGHKMHFYSGDALREESYQKGEGYDIILSTGFSEFLNDEDTERFYGLARKLLRPGGRFITSGMTPHKFSEYIMRNIAELNVSYRSEDQLRTLAKQAGFENISTYKDKHGLQTMLVATKD